MARRADTETEVLLGTGALRVSDVDVVNEKVLTVLRCDERLSDVMNVFELIRETTYIIEVDQG
jgi:hypothetical protein